MCSVDILRERAFTNLAVLWLFSASLIITLDDLYRGPCRPLTCYVCFYRHAVLDEADQMLERGFADSVEEILAASFSEGN